MTTLSVLADLERFGPRRITEPASRRQAQAKRLAELLAGLPAAADRAAIAAALPALNRPAAEAGTGSTS
ncbi:hypothetical protein GCM10010191_05890 [Actinomadura vinacea]|uniref:Uncharacterized protein n=1 Tax=Actinomadura vinacea TaxID=115336 RepID=A0ABN3ID67_9ACTN